MFCPKCGSLLMPKSIGNKKVMACSCGYKAKEQGVSISDKPKTKDAKIDVVEDSAAELETLPKMDVTCPKCSHKKAYYWLVQTRAADEAETKFLKCEKCGHTWRDYT